MLHLLCTYIEPKLNDVDHLEVSKSFILMEIVGSKDQNSFQVDYLSIKCVY